MWTLGNIATMDCTQYIKFKKGNMRFKDMQSMWKASS